MLHAPWSSPLLASLVTGSAINFSSLGISERAPFTGYSTANNFSGNPPKSWYVERFSAAVTWIPFVSQCAEITRMAETFLNCFPRLFRSAVYWFSAIAFMGEPWLTKRAGVIFLYVLILIPFLMYVYTYIELNFFI